MAQSSNRKLGRIDDHWAKGEDNLRLAKKCATDAEFGWSVIVAFYAAVHFVNAYLRRSGTTYVGSHAQRNSQMAANQVLSGIYLQYAELQELSEDARYGTAVFGESDARDAIGLADAIRRVLAGPLGK